MPRMRADGPREVPGMRPPLRSERLRLNAVLTPAAIPAGAPLLQSDGRFALRATLGAASLVCYADTIFRDNFDGDGF